MSLLAGAVETVAERGVVQWAEERGLLQTKLNLSGNRGWPDRCFWIPGGRPVLMEFKRAGKQPRRLQQSVIDKLKRLGYDAYCVDRKEDGINILCRTALAHQLAKKAVKRLAKEEDINPLREIYRVIMQPIEERRSQLVQADGTGDGRGSTRKVGSKKTRPARS